MRPSRSRTSRLTCARVNSALEAIGARIPEDERLQKEVAIYRSIAQDYLKHAVATIKLRG